MTEQTGSYLSSDSFKVSKIDILLTSFKSVERVSFLGVLCMRNTGWYEFLEINHLTCGFYELCQPYHLQAFKRPVVTIVTHYISIS